MAKDQAMSDHEELLTSAVNRLREAGFDSVQLFVSSYDPISGTTTHLDHGEGNIFARSGQVSRWVAEGLDDYMKSPGDEDDDE